MALFTKLFNKSHDPYELKGRWYKIKGKLNYVESGRLVSFSDISSDIGLTVISEQEFPCIFDPEYYGIDRVIVTRAELSVDNLAEFNNYIDITQRHENGNIESYFNLAWIMNFYDPEGSSDFSVDVEFLVYAVKR